MSDLQSVNTHGIVGLDRLIVHFVAAQQALSATSDVYAADEIVSKARGHVEQHAILHAKNIFITDGLHVQLRALQSVKTGLNTVGRKAQSDFEQVIKSLDVANDRLQNTLSLLRKTLVKSHEEIHHKSRPSPTQTSSATDSKSLYDFIDEDTYANLLADLRGLIDSYNAAQATLHASGTTLDKSLDEIITAIAEKHSTKSQTTSTPKDDDQASTIDSVYHTLVDHATEMASLLQSLISHYDLCVTALKHTEGGAQAARKATLSSISQSISHLDLQQQQQQENDPNPALENSLFYDDPDREPISNDERNDMLSVLETDAQQVDDVLSELHDRLAEMRTASTSLESLTQPSKSQHAHLSEIMTRMTSTNETHLTSTLTAARTFRETWSSLRIEIEHKTTDLSQLAQFYDSFAKSHNAMLREIERRALLEDKMDRVAERAHRDLAALYAEDKDMRAQFLSEVGEYLPRDIWPGLVSEPIRWSVTRHDAEKSQTIDDLAREDQDGNLSKSIGADDEHADSSEEHNELATAPQNK